MKLSEIGRQVEYLAQGGGLRWRLDELRQIALRNEVARVHEQVRRVMPANLLLLGYKVYSQTDEDGILQAIFERIVSGQLSQTFIEIGCGDGLENNTHALVLQGYRGFWLDGSAANISKLRDNVPSLKLPTSRLLVDERFVDLENIPTIVNDACQHLRTDEPDLLSLDIDGNDLVVLQAALRSCRPKVICIEYNGKFPPPIRVTIPYSKNFVWTSDDFQGASLQCFCDLLTDYTLVCCNVSGVNAFFVRNELSEHFELYPPRILYQPPRYDLVHLVSGHPRTYKWLAASLEDRIV